MENSPNVDSLSGKKKTDELVAKAMKLYMEHHLDEAEKLFEEAKILAEENHDAENISNVYSTLAKISMHRGHFDLVVEKINNVIEIAFSLGDKQREASSLNLLGVCLFNLGDISNALTNHFRGLKIAREIGNQKLESQFLNNISNCYHWMKENDTCLEYCQMALKLAESIGSENDICSMKSNLGFIYADMEKFEEAEKYLNESLEMNIAKVKNPDSLAKTYNNFASMYVKKNQHREALEYYEKCMVIVQEAKDESTISNTLQLMGNAYYKLGKYEKSLECHKEALELAVKINSKRLQTGINLGISETYEALGDYEKAYYHYTDYFNLETEATKEFSDLKVKYLNIAHKVDITKKEAEILHNKNEELNSINEKLIQLSEEKNEFLGIAAHDLKNPLNAITLAASNLIRGIDKLPSEKFNATIERIETTTNRMKSIIRNLLDVNSIESGTYNLKFENTNITKLLTDIVSDFKKAADEKNISLELENNIGEISFETDENALTEVLENLISNAIKYSEHGKKVVVSLKPFAENFRIDIIDSGLGIKEEEQSKVFAKFAKISNKPTAGEGSTGLGLSIVKKLTELLNGKISFTSDFGKGSTFTLEF